TASCGGIVAAVRVATPMTFGVLLVRGPVNQKLAAIPEGVATGTGLGPGNLGVAPPILIGPSMRAQSGHQRYRSEPTGITGRRELPDTACSAMVVRDDGLKTATL